MKGKLITDPYSIKLIALDRKSIWHNGTHTVMPAAIILNWQLNIVLNAIERKLLYEYIPKKKKEFHENVKQYPLTPKESYNAKDN